jgi:hypothetical protein
MQTQYMHFGLSSVSYIIIGKCIIFNLDYLLLEHPCNFRKLPDFIRS